MPAIERSSLMSLEDYARHRAEFRARVIAHKKNRTVHVGEHVTLLFEDELTMRYQVQEMLRIERIFEDEGIREELAAYNPLVPDGHNWKATMQIEYDVPAERAAALARLKGVEDRVWVAVGAHERVYAIADEDIERENNEKTSSVHFLRFELSRGMIDAVKSGAAIAIGVDHPAYRAMVNELAPAVRAALAGDLTAD